jgi:3-oxoadipate enol-lactonase
MSGDAAARDVVLFLHAYPLDRTMWRGQMDAAHAAGWTAVAPDFPGFGDAPHLGEGSLSEYAERTRRVLESVGATRAVVVGLSMGGYVAFRLLEDRPDVVRGLVLADTRAGADSPDAAQARLTAAERAEKEGTAWLADEMLPKLVADDADEEVRNEVRQIIGRATSEAVAGALRAMAARPDSSEVLRSVKVPALVLVGAEDKLTPPEEARKLAGLIAGAEYAEIPLAGHLSNLENPEAFNRALIGFLTQLKTTEARA